MDSCEMPETNRDGSGTLKDTDLSIRILHRHAVLAVVKNIRIAVGSGSKRVQVLVHCNTRPRSCWISIEGTILMAIDNQWRSRS